MGPIRTKYTQARRGLKTLSDAVKLVPDLKGNSEIGEVEDTLMCQLRETMEEVEYLESEVSYLRRYSRAVETLMQSRYDHGKLRDINRDINEDLGVALQAWDEL